MTKENSVTLLDLANEVVEDSKGEMNFYSNAKEYWSEIPPTIDGMLGGFASISHIDIKGSKALLKKVFHSLHPPGKQCALDCGAGIGRITKHLLMDIFEKVDLVEQNEAFLQQAEKYLGQSYSNKVGNFYCCGLQDFTPEPAKYDVIWMQWVSGHLTNADFNRFLKSSGEGLRPNGVIVIKENITSNDNVEIDEKDSSITRPIWLLKKLFSESNLQCYIQLEQNKFPDGLYSVYMFVLKPLKIYAPKHILSENEESFSNQMEEDIPNSILRLPNIKHKDVKRTGSIG